MSEPTVTNPTYVRVVEAYHESVKDRRTKEDRPKKVKLLDVLLSDARKALDESGAWYHEGGMMIGSNEYDMMITPRDVFEEQGIATEKEGHVVVSWEHPIDYSTRQVQAMADRLMEKTQAEHGGHGITIEH